MERLKNGWQDITSARKTGPQLKFIWRWQQCRLCIWRGGMMDGGPTPATVWGRKKSIRFTGGHGMARVNGRDV